MNKILSFFKLMADKIRLLLKQTRQLFSRKKSEPAAGSAQADPDRYNLDNDEYYDEYFTKINGLDDIMVKLGLYKRISACHKYMYEMGRRDGAIGVTVSNIVNIARATAQEMFRHIYVVLNGKLASLKGESDAAKSISEYDKSLYEREQAYYDYVKYQYRFFPRSHSFFLFLLYLVISVALILADIPLALQLIEKGFDLPGATEEDFMFINLFSGDFWKILAKNWETVFTAVGISLCTVYIKICYDEFVGTPYANRVMRFKQFINDNQLIKEREDLERDVHSEHRKKNRWKIGFLVLTLLSIVSLAFFRLQTTAVNGDLSGVSFFKGAAFVAITILFPVIGGICLSYSLNNIQNLVRLWRAEIQCESSRLKWTKSLKASTIKEQDYNDFVAAGSRLEDEEKMVQEYTNYLVAFYQRGYAIGSMQPEKYTKGEDFFNKVLEWRNIAISRKINNHISSLSHLNGSIKSIAVIFLTVSLFVGCGNAEMSVPPITVTAGTDAKEAIERSGYILCDFSVSQDKESIGQIIRNADELFKMIKGKKYNLSFYNISAPQYSRPFFEYKYPRQPAISKPSERDSLKKGMEKLSDSLHILLGQLSNNSSYKVTCIIRTLEQIANSLARTVDDPDKEIIKIIILSDLLEDCSYPEGRINIDHAEFNAAHEILQKMPKPRFTFSKYKNIEIILVASSQRNWNTDKGHGFWKAALAKFDYDLTGPIATDLPEL